MSSFVGMRQISHPMDQLSSTHGNHLLPFLSEFRLSISVKIRFMAAIVTSL